MRKLSAQRFGLLLCVLAALLSLPPFVAPVRASQTRPAPYVPGEVIVKLSNPRALTLLTLSYNLAVIDQIDGRAIYRLLILDASSPLTVADRLNRDSSVVYAEPNYIGEAPRGGAKSSWATGQGEGNYNSQWAPRKLRLPKAHSVSQGEGITIAVLDTGVDLHHPALKDHLVQGFDFVDLDADPSEEGTYGRDRGFGHGTHVAGLVVLAAPGAMVMPLRILKPDGTGNSWLLAQAVRYAHLYQADVLNLSYSVRHRSRLLDDLLAEVSSAVPGAVVVAAAGNSGESTPEYPAAETISGLLAVAASSKNNQLASFSSRGSWVDVAAPGENIVSTVPLVSGSEYGTWSGTSMAAPLASGTAALIRALNPQFNPAQVVERITSTAEVTSEPVPLWVDAASAVGL